MDKTHFNFNPPWIAHRGASLDAPENTMAAFRAAKDAGARWLEFDVMLAACGEPIVFHDETLERTTNGQGSVHEYSYSILKTLDAGSWFDPRFQGERIPRLSEVLAFLEKESLSANIEIKASRDQERETVTSVLKLLAKYQSLSRPLFSSFSIETLKELRLQAKNASLGLLMSDWEPDWEVIYEDLQCSSLNLHHKLLNSQVLEILKNKGHLVLTYTVNEPTQALELLSWGVDAIFTDCPGRMIALKS